MNFSKVLCAVTAASALIGVLATAHDAAAQSKLDRVIKDKRIVVGGQEAAAPYGYIDAQGNWVGWSMDLSKALHAIIEQKLGMKLELVFRPVTPQTRIPLIVNGSLDWVLGSTGKSVEREQVVDFSLTNNAVCVKKLVPKSSTIQSTQDLAGKRVGVTKGSIEERLLTTMSQTGELKPPVQVVTFDKHTTGFIALGQGKTDAHVTLEDTLLSMAITSPNPDEWEVRGPDVFCTISGIILPQNDSKWRNMVNHSLCYFITSGGYDKLFEEWFGGDKPKAGFKRKLSPEIRAAIFNQCPDGSETFIEAKK